MIADGRCSVASICLARGVIADDHITDECRRAIDTERSRLGQQLDKWTVADWVRRVPVTLRAANRAFVNSASVTARHSFDVYRELLTDKPPSTWLDPCVLYVASEEYDIGIFLIHNIDAGGPWYCRHIGQDKANHIVLYLACGHYECVEYDCLRLFPSDHEFVARMTQFSQHEPLYPKEDDVELQALQHVGSKADIMKAVVQHDDTTATSPPRKSEPQQAAPPLATPPTPRHRRAKRTTTSRNSGRASAKRALSLSEQSDLTQTRVRPDAGRVVGDGVKQLPAMIAQVAVHGPLYERVSFHNHAQWRAANEPLWNAYRLASNSGQRSQLTAILLDILLLPQRVLPKLGRSGRAARRRAVAGTGHRLRSEAERLRERYNCSDPSSKGQQQTQMSTETMANSMASAGHARPRRAASISARERIQQQAADTTDDASRTGSDEQAEGVTSDNEDERDNPFTLLSGRSKSGSSDPDGRAAQRADYLVQCGLMRKAAQVLHSCNSVRVYSPRNWFVISRSELATSNNRCTATCNIGYIY